MPKQIKKIKFNSTSDVYEIVDAEVREAVSALEEGKESVANKVTVIDSTSTNDQYPTAKAVYDLLDGIADEIAGI